MDSNGQKKKSDDQLKQNYLRMTSPAHFGREILLKKSVSGINKFAVRVFGYASEYIFLFTGVLLYAKPGA